MAEDGNGGQAPPQDEETGGVTVRTVMKRERVLVLPEDQDMSAELLAEIAKLLGVKPKVLRLLSESWHVIGEFEGAAKREAITAYTGPVGEMDTKIGVWKAPPARGWAGGLRTKAPPRPRVEAEAID
jgi:hypothetical protein